MNMLSAITGLLAWRGNAKMQTPTRFELTATISAAEPNLSEHLREQAIFSLEDQMREVFDRNADGINKAAKVIRDQSDSLLSLGITDDRVARAGTLAQLAVELANKGRGIGLDRIEHQVSVEIRRQYVETALATVAQAEVFMTEATAANKKQIRSLFQHQSRMLTLVRENPLTESFVK